MSDTLHAWALGGERPADLLLEDIHAHLGRLNHYHIPDGAPAAVAAELDRLGIHTSFVFQIEGVTNGEFEWGNDRIAAAMRAHPRHFLGLCMVNPHESDRMIQELERCRQLGFAGVKLIPGYQGYPEEGPNVELAVQFAHKHGMPILNHHWGGAAWLERLARTYPDAQLICGHLGRAWDDVINRCENVWLCTCAHHHFGLLANTVAAVRNDRIAWGSDYSDLHFGFGLGPILLADIPEAAKRAILGENMRSLREKCGLTA